MKMFRRVRSRSCCCQEPCPAAAWYWRSAEGDAAPRLTDARAEQQQRQSRVWQREGTRRAAHTGGKGRQRTALEPSVEGTVNFYFRFIYVFKGNLERLPPSRLSVISENLEP